MLKTWDELTPEEINEKLYKSEADIAAGHTLSQEELDSRMRSVFIEKKERAGMSAICNKIVAKYNSYRV